MALCPQKMSPRFTKPGSRLSFSFVKSTTLQCENAYKDFILSGTHTVSAVSQFLLERGLSPFGFSLPWIVRFMLSFVAV